MQSIINAGSTDVPIQMFNHLQPLQLSTSKAQREGHSYLTFLLCKPFTHVTHEDEQKAKVDVEMCVTFSNITPITMETECIV